MVRDAITKSTAKLALLK